VHAAAVGKARYWITVDACYIQQVALKQEVLKYNMVHSMTAAAVTGTPLTHRSQPSSTSRTLTAISMLDEEQNTPPRFPLLSAPATELYFVDLGHCDITAFLRAS
jgi:hypothetical protein